MHSYSLIMRYTPASTRSADDVEIIARLRRIIWIDRDHDSLENVQGRKTTDTAAIKAEEVEISARHRLSSWVARALSQSCYGSRARHGFINARDADTRPHLLDCCKPELTCGKVTVNQDSLQGRQLGENSLVLRHA
jgi:hypothetical protein